MPLYTSPPSMFMQIQCFSSLLSPPPHLCCRSPFSTCVPFLRDTGRMFAYETQCGCIVRGAWHVDCITQKTNPLFMYIVRHCIVISSGNQGASWHATIAVFLTLVQRLLPSAFLHLPDCCNRVNLKVLLVPCAEQFV